MILGKLGGKINNILILNVAFSLTYISINQVLCFLVQAIATFHGSRSLKVHLYRVKHLVTLLVHPTSFLAIFRCCVFLKSFQLSQDVQVFSSHHMAKKKKKKHGLFAFYIGDLVISASRKTVLFDLFFCTPRVSQKSSRNDICVVSSFFCRLAILKLFNWIFSKKLVKLDLDLLLMWMNNIIFVSLF